MTLDKLSCLVYASLLTVLFAMETRCNGFKVVSVGISSTSRCFKQKCIVPYLLRENRKPLFVPFLHPQLMLSRGLRSKSLSKQITQ